MYKIGICGHFGDGKNLLNGQTVKTKILTEELVNHLGKNEVTTIDTHFWAKNPISLIIYSFQLMKKSKNVIILPANRGLKVFVPLFLSLNKIFHRKLHYVVIGGWLPEILRNDTILKRQLAKFDGIYVETHSMVEELKIFNFGNIHYLPNFKQLNILNKEDLIYHREEPYKLCTFSRVMEEKGIEDAIEAVIRINTEANREVYSLDIFGQIEPEYKNRFLKLQEQFPDFITYKGKVPFNESVEVLKNYFALLFPTHFQTEGIPGTIIDAYAAGIPVVSSKWNSFDDIVEEGKTGIGYKLGDVEALTNILYSLTVKPSLVFDMKINCIEQAHKFASETVVKKFIDKLEM